MTTENILINRLIDQLMVDCSPVVRGLEGPGCSMPRRASPGKWGQWGQGGQGSRGQGV